MRGAITVITCLRHGRTWIKWAGRYYGAPCPDPDACEALPTARRATYVSAGRQERKG